ncbi:MAG: heavy metal-binding domain-containing protein, partial [Candidatus Omnitrophota bacterium]
MMSKSEIRNPKSETNPKSEFSKSKTCFGHLNFCNSILFRYSIFDIRIYAVIFILVFSASLSFAQHEGHQVQTKAKQESQVKKPTKQKDIYYCPMHPSYTSDKPGDCPICNMKLVKKEEAQKIEESAKTPKEICILHNCPMLKGTESCPMQISGDVKDCPYCGAHLDGADSSGGFYISSEKQQLIGVKTDKVIYRLLNKVIRTVGRVAFDPELYKTQQEYIEALNTQESLKQSGQEEIVKRTQALVDAAELKLKLQGLDAKQIEELKKSKENDQALLISSGSDNVWVYATIYEYELEWIKNGL